MYNLLMDEKDKLEAFKRLAMTNIDPTPALEDQYQGRAPLLDEYLDALNLTMIRGAIDLVVHAKQVSEEDQVLWDKMDDLEGILRTLGLLRSQNNRRPQLERLAKKNLFASVSAKEIGDKFNFVPEIHAALHQLHLVLEPLSQLFPQELAQQEEAERRRVQSITEGAREKIRKTSTS